MKIEERLELCIEMEQTQEQMEMLWRLLEAQATEEVGAPK